MASLSASAAFTGKTSALRHQQPFALKGVAPLRTPGLGNRRRINVGPVRAAYGGRSSPYTAPGGRDMPVERDLYEGTTGVDVLAMQKDPVAEGYLSPANATGCVSKPARVFRFPVVPPKLSRRALEELLRYHAIVRSARPAPGDARSRPGPRPQRSSKLPEENKRFFDATSQTITTRAVCSVPPRARPFRRCSSSSAFPSTASGDTSSASCSTTPACEPRRRPPRGRSCPPITTAPAPPGPTAGSTGPCRRGRSRRATRAKVPPGPGWRPLQR